MPLKPKTRKGAHDRAAILAEAVAALRASGILDHLNHPEGVTGSTGRTTRSGRRRGRPPVHGQWNVIAVLATMWEIAATDGHMTLANILDRVWYIYSDAQLAILGLDQFRDPERQKAMAAASPLLDVESPAMRRRGPCTPVDRSETGAMAEGLLSRRLGNDEFNKARNMWRAEYQRLWRFVHTGFAIIDNTPVPGRAANGERAYTVGEVREARANPDLTATTERLHNVCNAIVAAGLKLANEQAHPGTTLHTGLLRDHRGDVAIDEKHITVGIAQGGDHRDHAAASGNRIADYDGHNRRFKKAFSVGATIGVAAYRPNGDRGPSVALGFRLHRPTAGDGPAALAVLDHIEATGLRTPTARNTRPRLITDMGYSVRPIHQDVLARGYDFHMKYPKGNHTAHPLRHPDGTPSHVTLYQGVPVCPGAGRVLIATPFEAPEPASWTHQVLKRHQEAETMRKAVTMPRNGAPTIGSGRSRGGQRKTDETPDPVVQLDVQCPARAGKVRCPLIAGTMSHPDMADKPQIPDYPKGPELPKCCTAKKWTTLTLNGRALRQHQPDMVGTWGHADFYSSARAHNEGFNARLIDPHGGGNLWHSNIGFRRNGLYSLAIAITIAVTNSKVIEAWAETLHDNHGNPPPSSGPGRRAKRDHIRNNAPDRTRDPTSKAA